MDVDKSNLDHITVKIKNYLLYQDCTSSMAFINRIKALQYTYEACVYQL